MSPAKRRASMVLLLVVMLAGIAYGVAQIPKLKNDRLAATEINVGGRRVIQLSPGSYDIYYEPANGFQPFSIPGDLHVTVAPVAGAPLALSGAFGSNYIGSTGSQGRELASLRVPHSGDYTIEATGGSDTFGADVVLGQPTLWILIRMIGAFVIALLAFIALCNLAGAGAAARTYRLGDAGPGAVGTFGLAGAPHAARTIVIDHSARLVAAGTAAGPDPADQLSRLVELRDRGVVSEEEFEAAKQRLLGGGGG